MNSSRPILTLAEIEAFDPGNNSARRLCPLCGEAKPRDASHRSLSLDLQTGKWKCFRCEVGGVLREFWRQRENSHPFPICKSPFKPPGSPFQAAFAPKASTPSPPPFESLKNNLSPKNEKPLLSDESPSTPPPLAPWRLKWERTVELENTRGATYLEKRGIVLEVATLSGARFHPNWSGHASVVFPIKNRAGEIVAAQARAVEGEAKLTGGPKIEGAYMAPLQMKSGRVFSPLDASTPVIAITEAPIDALSLAVAGFPALALCGTSGPNWLHLACGLRRVALALDADDAGERASSELEKILSPFGARCFRLRPDGAKDWNEMLQQSGANALGDFLSLHLL